MDPGLWNSSLPQPLVDLSALWKSSSANNIYEPAVIIICTLVAITYFTKGPSKGSEKYTTINPSTDFEVIGKARRLDYLRNARFYFSQGVKRFPRMPFKVLADHGNLTVLPASWAHDIRNEPNLSFMKAFHDEFHADFAPFKPFAAGSSDDELLQTVSRKQLSKGLNKVAKPLSDEAKFALDLTFGTPSDWKEFALKPALLDIVARISSCVFLGSNLCRNEQWLEVTKTYTIAAFLAAEEVRAYPKWLRGIVQLYLPSCRRLLGMIDSARNVIDPIVEERRALARQGRPMPEHHDAIDWFEEEAAGRPYDPTLCQMMLSVAAIHTTTDLANETLLNLGQRPELIAELRKEIVEVLQVDGWKKTSLYNLKLLDSVLKESQRLSNPPGRMNRKAIGDVTLPDGTVLRKGERAIVSTSGMFDPQVYEDPLRFDPFRFARLRDQEGMQNQAHLVSTGPSHLGFGHGKHACPGRFFASNELKIMLCHIIIKYDFKLPEGYTPKYRQVGTQKQPDPASRMLFVAREPEIDLDGLGF